MAKWIDIGAPSDFPAGERKFIQPEGQPVCVLNVDNQIHAVANVCPHAGLPVGEGELCGQVITCPFHGYSYDIVSGKNVDYADDVPLPVYPVRVEGDKIQIDLEPFGNG